MVFPLSDEACSEDPLLCLGWSRRGGMEYRVQGIGFNRISGLYARITRTLVNDVSYERSEHLKEPGTFSPHYVWHVVRLMGNGISTKIRAEQWYTCVRACHCNLPRTQTSGLLGYPGGVGLSSRNGHCQCDVSQLCELSKHCNQ